MRKTTKRFIWGSIALAAILIAALVFYLYPTYKFFFDTEIINIDPKLTVFKGGGGTSTIITTDSAIVVIDTKMMGNSEKLFNLAKEKAGKKPIIVINTHYHSDHVKGNHFFKGSKIYIGNYDKAFLSNGVAPENMPTDFVADSLVMNLGDETLILYNLGRAHTWNDMVIYIKNRKILVTGDLVFSGVNPVLRAESGACVKCWLEVLNQIINRWDVKTYIPGHGPFGGKEIAISLKNYFVDAEKAAGNSELEKQFEEKYKDWVKIARLSTPATTINFIKTHNEKPIERVN